MKFFCGGVFQYAENDGAIRLGHKPMYEKSILGH